MPQRIVLIVDDNQDLAQALGDHLTAKGYQIVFALDGAAASMQAQRHKPDLIILDYHMPAASGTTVYERLQRSANTFSIPIIFISAGGIDRVKESVPQSHRVRFMEKPVDIPKLIQYANELAPN